MDCFAVDLTNKKPVKVKKIKRRSSFLCKVDFSLIAPTTNPILQVKHFCTSRELTGHRRCDCFRYLSDLLMAALNTGPAKNDQPCLKKVATYIGDINQR